MESDWTQKTGGSIVSSLLRNNHKFNDCLKQVGDDNVRTCVDCLKLFCTTHINPERHECTPVQDKDGRPGGCQYQSCEALTRGLRGNKCPTCGKWFCQLHKYAKDHECKHTIPRPRGSMKNPVIPGKGLSKGAYRELDPHEWWK